MITQVDEYRGLPDLLGLDHGSRLTGNYLFMLGWRPLAKQILGLSYGVEGQLARQLTTCSIQFADCHS